MDTDEVSLHAWSQGKFQFSLQIHLLNGSLNENFEKRGRLATGM